jgi:hypothetical protein
VERSAYSLQGFDVKKAQAHQLSAFNFNRPLVSYTVLSCSYPVQAAFPNLTPYFATYILFLFERPFVKAMINHDFKAILWNLYWPWLEYQVAFFRFNLSYTASAPQNISPLIPNAWTRLLMLWLYVGHMSRAGSQKDGL